MHERVVDEREPSNYVFMGVFCVRSRVDGQEVSWVYGRLRIESVGWTALVPFHSIPVLPRKDSSAPSKQEQQVTWTASVMLQRSTLTAHRDNHPWCCTRQSAEVWIGGQHKVPNTRNQSRNNTCRIDKDQWRSARGMNNPQHITRCCIR